MRISEGNPLKAGDKVRLMGSGWAQYRGEVVEVDRIEFGQPWSNVTGVGSLAFSVGTVYTDGYEVERVEGTSGLTLPEKAVKIVENLTSVGFTKGQACEIAMLAVRKEAENV